MYNPVKHDNIELREKILDFLAKNKDNAYSENELAEIFEVSKLAIRLNVRTLKNQGKIEEIRVK